MVLSIIMILIVMIFFGIILACYCYDDLSCSNKDYNNKILRSKIEELERENRELNEKLLYLMVMKDDSVSKYDIQNKWLNIKNEMKNLEKKLEELNRGVEDSEG